MRGLGVRLACEIHIGFVPDSPTRGRASGGERLEEGASLKSNHLCVCMLVILRQVGKRTVLPRITVCFVVLGSHIEILRTDSFVAPCQLVTFFLRVHLNIGG